MAKGNVAVRQFMRNKNRFADFYNVKVFGGKQVVLPAELEEIDSESDILLEDKEDNTRTVQRYRDVVMRWKGSINLAILACENQAKVHYAMPVRNMIYDGLSYADQMKQLWDTHEGKDQKLTREEYMSRFRKEDKLIPVITLVWYYGTEPWDGSADLYGMFSEYTLPKEILDNFVPNYKINLVMAEDIEDVNHFRTDLQYIFGMLKCRKSKEKLVSFTNENSEYFHCVDGESYLAISELLHSEKLLKNSVKREEMEDGVDMCKALEDLYQEGVEKGRQEACKALEDLYQEGRTELLLETLKDLGPVSEELQQKILNEKNLDILKKWNKLAARAESIEEFLKEMEG